ncbi:SDR family oxidoreductase [Deinococcus sp. Arct2-2]|uniref:SDR family oxidoreductase n=1 Tax=Deinococcus sp. Arct2-2 TaxID=2568653 RepID=UPI0010A3AC5F|nr:SDR family oxidoreductase [Deinococcus sp. Arct2-2]THF69579.1 SDR family oxidoreductase [Deinococcus sp. Arct2-2]
MTDRQTRTAIVTGASRGIGAAIAQRLGRDGIAVVVNYSNDPAPAQAVADKITGAGGQAMIFKADVSDSAAMKAMFDQAEAAFGGVDILINNGGVMMLKPLAEADDDLFDRQVAINLKGAFNGMREAARRLRDGGRIVNFSSSVVGLYPPTYAVYAATKAATEAMTHILAKELGQRNITVNAVAPGPVETHLFTDGKSPEQIQQTASMNPLGRLGQPDDIAGAVAFLVGLDGGWINGQVIRANGGVV